MWVNQKRKKLDKLWSAGAKPERKERFFSMQLISQGSPTMKINYLEGNGLEWLMQKGLLLVLTESRILWGREGINLLVHACRSNFLSILFFWFFSFLSFPHTRFFLFPGISFRIPIPSLWFPSSSSFLFTASVSFYSACRDRILLF